MGLKMPYCNNCGTWSNSSVCPNCGSQITDDGQSSRRADISDKRNEQSYQGRPDQRSQQPQYQRFSKPRQEDDDKKIILIVVGVIVAVFIAVIAISALFYLSLPSGMPGDSYNRVVGNLQYEKGKGANATFYIYLEEPKNPSVGSVNVRVLDEDGRDVSIQKGEDAPADYHWEHSNSDGDHLKDEDKLHIHLYNDRDWEMVSGYKVIISVDGYTGTFPGAKIP